MTSPPRRSRLLATTALAMAAAHPQTAPTQQPPPSFEIATRRMDVDVDGAPRAYGPAGKTTLDYLKHARYRGRPQGEIVGFLTDDDHPKVPVVQGPNDPAPGYYISQTAFTDPKRTEERDVSRYVNAAAINYVVLGKQARKQGARLGDFVAVYSRRTERSVFGIVADDGNPSGDEGSLHLLQALGYPYRDGKEDSVERRGEIVVRFYPHSNPPASAHGQPAEFFRTQTALDAAALQHGLSRDFSASPLAAAAHPKH